MYNVHSTQICNSKSIENNEINSKLLKTMIQVK